MAAVRIRHRAEQQHAARALGQRRQSDIQVAIGAFIGHQDRSRARCDSGGGRQLGSSATDAGMQPDAPVRLRQKRARGPRRPGARAHGSLSGPMTATPEFPVGQPANTPAGASRRARSPGGGKCIDQAIGDERRPGRETVAYARSGVRARSRSGRRAIDKTTGTTRWM